MKGKKRKTEKQKIISVTRAVERMLLLTAAYLMEEYQWDEDDLINYYTKIAEWSEAIDQHLITCKQVAQIITDKTGAKITW